MAKYRKKPVIIEAVQWQRNGDHPDDQCIERRDPVSGEAVKSEGKVVRYFRHPEISGTNRCRECGEIMHRHGYIDTPEGGHIVCPGDWVVTGTAGERYPVKDRIFGGIYEKVDQVLD